MTDAARALVEISAALALGDQAALEQRLARALPLTSPMAIEEVLLQSYLFLGYPAALRGLTVWRQLQPQVAPSAQVPEDQWRWRGAATCAQVYGGRYDRLRQNIAALHPEMEQWMIQEGYGKVLSRPGLDLATRELCIIALLAPQDAAPQLYSHMRGALNAGASESDVAEVVFVLTPKLSERRTAAMTAQWEAVRTRTARGA